MNKPVDLFKAAADIKKLILETHNIQQIKNSADYNGIDIEINSILAHSNSLKDSMKKANIKYEKGEGFDMLDVIIYKTLQIGYQNAIIYHNLE